LLNTESRLAIFQGYGLRAKSIDGYYMAKTTKRRALLIVNPNARNGKGFGGMMRTELERGGLDLFEHQPRESETISDVISRERDHDLVVIGGGDGSLNAAARGLMETGMPLAILPLGTANDFARTSARGL
jgi:diacylglycerol kinase family enzyme